MTHNLTVQFETLESLKGQLNYTNDCLVNGISEMEDCEVLEFINMGACLTSEINFLTNHLKSVA